MGRTRCLPSILFLVAAIGALLFFGFASGCSNKTMAGAGTGSGSGSPSTGSGSGPTSPGAGYTVGHLAVADTSNNRVLIYTAPYKNDAAATIVLGQADFTHNAANQGGTPAANTLDLPDDLAMDTNGDLFVADSANCRVLEFQPPFTTNMDASLVIGQASFTQGNGNGCGGTLPTTGSATSIPGLHGITLDESGNLWVSDSLEARVLEFRAPLSNGMAASLVLGQTNFQNIYPCNGGYETKINPPPPPTANVFCNPGTVTVDSANDVWVGDYTNGRVLRFAPPFSTGMAASLELGWPASAAFTSGDNSVCNGSNDPISATTVCTPEGVAFDPNGDFWVSDGGNPRILQYMHPFSNGMAASLVIGEANMTAFHNISVSANSLGLQSSGISFHGASYLYVADLGANRVLIFAPPFTNDMSASLVLGQPNMTSSGQNQAANNAPGGPPTAQTLIGPMAVHAF